MQPDAYLANAQRMIRQSEGKPDECGSRAILHAAYYSVFHLVAPRLGLNPAVQGQAHHSTVSRTVTTYSGDDGVINACKGSYESLRVARVDADYKLEDAITYYEAIVAVSRALRVFAAAGVVPAAT